MTLIQLLEKYEEEIILAANDVLIRMPLKHYKKAGKEENQIRLKTLYNSIFQSVKKNNLLAIIKYAEQIAAERFTSGYEIHEVQTAFNVLEEVIWRKIIQKLQPADVIWALRLISTVLGAGKESLANTYVTFAGKMPALSIDHSALFEGTDGS